MSDSSIHGLNCPRCGGMVPVPEGQVIVACPYCDQRSVVSAVRKGNGTARQYSSALKSLPAEAAIPAQNDLFIQPSAPVEIEQKAEEDGASLCVRRYQAPLRIPRFTAEAAFRDFLSGKFQVARDAVKEAKVTEAFLVHLPFWVVWGRGVAFAYGQDRVGSGDHKRYEPRERKVVKEMDFNTPACEVGEFGVRQISLEGCPLEPFDAAGLHRSGMVFEPVGSSQAVLAAARESFMETVRGEINLDRTEQVFARLTRPRLGLVYYPLWVMRYLYHGRAFQVVIDGFNGQVLYGKAPGSVTYRAGMLVGGMAAGAVVTIDIPVLILGAGSDDDSPLMIAAVIFLIGLSILWWSFRAFRYGEHYEYHRFGKPKGSSILGELPGDLKDVEKLARSLEKFT